ncbi:hypothetical protein MMAG44476_03927 [Mycolicibacterium mageritense DSM 44476 = CIP 104973]|uniref:Uncharacterized protein n=1 Tax=Mycolicibacterium mageritense TaxID=53462 RepID=A0ABN5YDU4_MYCME|nr:DUF5995 family protein [Mycolicibacterium mageritense]MCC9185681.1 DUF5995 family protein [Mycolicibacterium mageritense]BBX36191.1 hypothetical protein MMAGJ_54730 [Mycolicibacterium mageritense]CDO24303.1 hypothetical protein BN978_04799 [Mycolicibacterium mageritense DSM 44476 = CIP 104973]
MDQLPPLPRAATFDDVIGALDAVIAWSVEQSSRLGYFAALYKRITIAVRTAVADGVFEDGPRLQRLDVAFANRYFDAVNGHFHPGRFPKPTRSWRVTFDAADSPEPIMLQHMLAGINAHIGLDLGIAAAAQLPRARLWELQTDFDRINAVLASQVNGIVVDINELSPALADVYAVLMDNQIFLINEAVRTLRDDAWRFATLLALQPGFTRPFAIRIRDHHVAGQGSLIYRPPGVVGLIQWAVNAVAARESRDVVRNIKVLDEIACAPAPIATAL